MRLYLGWCIAKSNRARLLCGQRLADHAREGDGTSAAVASGHVRIRMCVVRVPDVDNGMVRLCQRGVENVIVRCGFVGEALAVEIDLQPRIRTHPEQGADRVRPAELIGFYSNAVEDHRGADFVHVRARPQARLDAVARGAVDGDGEGVLVHGLRLQGFDMSSLRA